MEELKTKVFEKYKDDKDKLEQFKQIYKIYTEKEEVLLEYYKIHKQYIFFRKKLEDSALLSKKAHMKWDECQDQLNEF